MKTDERLAAIESMLVDQYGDANDWKARELNDQTRWLIVRSCLAALMKISKMLGLPGIVNPSDTVKAVEAMKAERDKLAAELGEVRDAVAWSWSMEKHYLFYGYLPDAILAAWRATKGKEPTP